MSGLYGVLSHVVASRSREMGIRLAVGARPSRIIRLVLLDGVRPIVFGLTAGVGTLALLMRGTGRVLSGFPLSMDLAVLSGVVGAFLLVGVLACYFPARRAAKTDPRVLLRQL
jgi:putative ABC transport system permease protein